jgi:hypothetical protein
MTHDATDYERTLAQETRVKDVFRKKGGGAQAWRGGVSGNSKVIMVPDPGNDCA